MDAIKAQSPQGGDEIVGVRAVGDRPLTAAGFEKSMKSIIPGWGVLVLGAKLESGITIKGGMTP